MTIKEIKAMFTTGSRWHAKRESERECVIHDNTGTTVLVPKNVETLRTVEKCGSKDIVFRLETGKKYYTPIPKASEVLEARPGYLAFTIPDVCLVTLTQVTQ